MPDVSGQQKKRYFSGYFRSFVQRPRAEGLYCYEATIVPVAMVFSRGRPIAGIFHSAMTEPPDEMTVPGIIKTVFKDHGFDDFTPSLHGTYRKMDHACRYRETDFNFVSRLMGAGGNLLLFRTRGDGREPET